MQMNHKSNKAQGENKTKKKTKKSRKKSVKIISAKKSNHDSSVNNGNDVNDESEKRIIVPMRSHSVECETIQAENSEYIISECNNDIFVAEEYDYDDNSSGRIISEDLKNCSDGKHEDLSNDKQCHGYCIDTDKTATMAVKQAFSLDAPGEEKILQQQLELEKWISENRWDCNISTVESYMNTHATLLSNDMVIKLIMCEWWPNRLAQWLQYATDTMEQEDMNKLTQLVDEWETMEKWLHDNMDTIRHDENSALQQLIAQIDECKRKSKTIERYLRQWQAASTRLQESIQSPERTNIERALAEAAQFNSLAQLRSRALSLIQEQIILKVALREAIHSTTLDRHKIEQCMLEIVQSVHNAALQELLNEAEEVLKVLCNTDAEEDVSETDGNHEHVKLIDTLHEEPGTYGHAEKPVINLHPLLDQLRQSVEPLLLAASSQSKRLRPFKVTRSTEQLSPLVESITEILSLGLRRVYMIFGSRDAVSLFQESPLVDLQRAVQIFRNKKLMDIVGQNRSESEVFIEFLLDQGVLYKYVAALMEQQRGYLESIYGFQNDGHIFSISSGSILLDTVGNGLFFKHTLLQVSQYLEFELGFPSLLHEKRFDLLLSSAQDMIQIIETGSSYAHDLAFNAFQRTFSPYLYKYLSMDLKCLYGNDDRMKPFYMLYDVVEFAAELQQIRRTSVKRDTDAEISETSIITAVAAVNSFTSRVSFKNRKIAQFCKFQLFTAYCLNNRLLGDVIRTIFTDKRLTVKFFDPHLVVVRQPNWENLCSVTDALSNISTDDTSPFDICLYELLEEAFLAGYIRDIPQRTPRQRDSIRIHANLRVPLTPPNSPSLSSFTPPPPQRFSKYKSEHNEI